MSFLGELKVGDIILVGDAANAEELFGAAPTVDPDADDEEGIFFGKIEVIYLNDDSEYVCVLSCPELTEVFEKLNVSSETEINFEDYPEAVEALKQEGVNSLCSSDDFAIFLLFVNSAVDNYAAERDILADSITSASFKDKVTINKPDVTVNGSTITMNFDCSYKNEFKNKNGKKLGEFTIDFTLKFDFSINVSVDYKIKWKWKVIPKGIEYFDISLKQTDLFTIDFNINFNVDYELEKADQQYYYNKRSKKLHVYNCQYENITYKENIVYIDATELHEYAKKPGFSTCERCKPIEGLDRTAFVINTHEYSSGSGIYTIHCFNCQYVEEQILPANMQLYFCSYKMVRTKLKGKKTQDCPYCKPQDRELLSFEDDLLYSYEYADWGDQVAKIKEWATGAGAEEYQEPDGIKLVDIHYVAWVATVNFEVRISLTFDFKAALNFHYEQSHVNVYGIRLQNGGVKPYSKLTKSEKATLNLSGSFNFRAGVRADGYVSIVGLSKWIRAGLYIEAGPYMRGRGIVYLTTEKDINNYAAAYFSTGVYVKSSCYYKLFRLSGKVTIIDKEYPIATYGYDKAYYCYTDGIDELDLNSNETLTLKDIASKLTVQYYDVINEKSKTEKFSLNSKNYKVKFSLKNGEYCYIQNGAIKISSSAPSNFTDELLITVTGNDSWKRYVKGSSAVYLSTRSITINVTGCTHNYAVESSKAATCTEGGFTDYKCTICGYEYTETIFALGHDKVNHVAQAPTCTAVGWSAYITCRREGCNYSTYSEISVLDHDFKLGVCTHCGALDPNYGSKGLSFKLNDDGESYSVWGIGSCVDKDVVVPVIGGSAFSGCYGLTSITIPDSVTSIGRNAFFN